MIERINLTEEYLKSIGTLKGIKGLGDAEIKQILDDNQNIQRVNDLMAELRIDNLELFCANAITWRKRSEMLRLLENNTDGILLKENKQLRNIWKNEEDLRNKYQIENCILKQKLEKIQYLIDHHLLYSETQDFEKKIREILESD